MQTFLAEVAQKLFEEHPHDLDKVTVVFNNRRSGLFLRRQLAQLRETPFFLPRIIGIDDLISELGGLEIVPKELLIFELYDIHRKMDTEVKKYETFEEFISFGDMLLNDFSEIDLYQVNAEDIFANLHDLKAIGEWDIEGSELTSLQRSYLQFYKNLYQYYAQLRERLIGQGKAYSGMAYRNVADHIDSMIDNIDSKQICFVGFNALSKCEKVIIKECIKKGIGKFYTDGDAYYFNNEVMEAGRFLNEHKEDFADIGNYADHFAMGHKDITIVSCPESVLQTKYAGKLLEEQASQDVDSMSQTALVLGDEGLLLPTLNALPANVKTANVTMGFPYTSTEVHSLMLKLLSLYQHSKNNLFYHQDVVDILADPLVVRALERPGIYHDVVGAMSKDHVIYASFEYVESLLRELSEGASRIMSLFHNPSPTPTQFLSVVKGLLSIYHAEGLLKDNVKENEALACLTEIVEYFIDIQQRYQYMESLSVLSKIYTRLAQRRSIAFYGEPLSGVQVLGVLETRNLDFKKVILLSANEGVIPSGRTNNTLIPYNLKSEFHIPTYKEKDSVYAYNFYRLLQRADNVYLLYSTESDGMGKGEPSRFVMQVRMELASRYPDSITIHEEVLSADNDIDHCPPASEVVKSEAVMSRLYFLGERGLSPSSLNTYRSCPMKFYYEEVLSVRKQDDIQDDLDQSELGNIVHHVLEHVYRPAVGRAVAVAEIQSALDDVDTLLEEELKSQFQYGRDEQGRNHLVRAIAKSQLTHFFENELRLLEQGHEIEIVGIEDKLVQHLSVTVMNQTHQVKIHGRADRIDRLDGQVRIVDYKTGKVSHSDLKLNDADPNIMSVSDKWFQVMVYAWMYQQDHPNEQAMSGILPLGQFNSDVVLAEWCGNNCLTSDSMAQMGGMLSQLVSDIMNPELPFVCNPDSKACAYCPFAEVCRES